MPAAWRIKFEEACIVTPSLRIDPRFEARVKRDEPMSRHTSWHVGGPADLFFTPKDNHIFEMISLTHDDDETGRAVVDFIRGH